MNASIPTVDGGNDIDASSVKDAAFPPSHWPAVLLVDGLVSGNATDTNGNPITLDDVRVCIFDANDQPITDYAKPDDAPMPLANYPGVRLGSGVDLGSFPTGLGAITVAVFSAAALTDDAAWKPDRTAFTCTNIACDQGVTCKPHVKLSATLGDDVNVLGLVDGTSAVQMISTTYVDLPYAGAPGSLYGGVVDFSGWQPSGHVAASYGDLGDAGAAGATLLADPVVPDQATRPVLVTNGIASYENAGVRFDATDANTSFAQSLDSIAYVTDPTLDPPTFYGVRANFVFALVGDPSDPTSVQNNGGRDPAFDGRGLHITAVSYASPEPQQ